MKEFLLAFLSVNRAQKRDRKRITFMFYAIPNNHCLLGSNGIVEERILLPDRPKKAFFPNNSII